MRKHYVTFLSPGTFVAEQSTRPIDQWDTGLAVEMSTTIVERYNARPYAFFFSTQLTAPPIPDGEGGMLRVKPKTVSRSPLHFLGGTVLTLDDVKSRGNARDSILIDNMRWSCPIVVENTNGFRSVNDFREMDVVVDARGAVVERGDTPERVAYRARVLERNEVAG